MSLVSAGLHSMLGAREVTLHRVSEQASLRWGPGVPLFSRSKKVAGTDRVQVDDGRVRPFEELVSPERARAVSELEARLRGPEAASALASTTPDEHAREG